MITFGSATTMHSPGYTSLPGGWSQERKKSVVAWGAYQIPTVPLACCLLIIAGLPMWAAGMLQARSNTDGISEHLPWHIAADTIARLKVAVLVAVVLLSPLVAGVLACNVWLEASRAGPPHHTETGLSLSRYTSNSTRVNAANWVLLLLLATVALSGSVAWLTVMSGVLSATAGGGGGGPPAPPWWPPAAAPAAAAAPPPAPAALLNNAAFSVAVPTAAHHQVANARKCAPGCIDVGAAAALLRLPGGCVCLTWLPADLKTQLQQAVRSLSIAVAGALLLLVGQSLLFGYIAGQSVHAARDLEELLRQGDGLLVVGGTAAAAAGGSVGPH